MKMFSKRSVGEFSQKWFFISIRFISVNELLLFLMSFDMARFLGRT